MLDPNEPDTSTQETNEEPPAQPAPRRRRAASRPAGPPSSAPNAPTIERPTGLPEPVSEGSTEAELASPPEKTAKKSAAKRTTKKVREETPPSEGEVVKTPRKRTAKKTVALATEATPDEAPAPAAEPEGVVQAPDQALPGDTDTVADAAIEEKLEAACGRGTGSKGTCAKGACA